MEVENDPNLVVVNLEHCVSSDGGHLGKSSCIYTTTVPTNSCHDMLQLATSVQCLSDINQSLSRSFQHQHLAQLQPLQYPQVQVSYDSASAGGLQQNSSILPPPSSIFQGSTLHYPQPPSFLTPLPPQSLHILESAISHNQPNSQISLSADTPQPFVEESKHPEDDYDYYKEIENYLLNEELPTGTSEAYLKNLKSRAKHYLIVGNVLHHNPKNPRRVVMQKEEQLHLLQRAHLVEKTGIHQGIKKMLAALHEKHFWRGMYVAVANYVKKCKQCRDSESPLESHDFKTPAIENNCSAPRMSSVSMQTNSLTWREVEISVHGPFKVTSNRNESIVTVTDPASCFVVGTSIGHHSQSAKVTQFILHTFYTFGFPFAKVTVPSNLYDAINAELNCYLKRKKTKLQLTSKDDDNRLFWVSQLMDILVKRYPSNWDKELDKFLYQFRTGGIKQFDQKWQLTPFYSMYHRRHTADIISKGKENIKKPAKRQKKKSGRLWQCPKCVESFTSKISYRFHVKLHRTKPSSKENCASPELCPDLRVPTPQNTGKVSFTAPEDCVELTVSAVRAVLVETKDERRKRGKYQKYSAETQQRMASYAAKYGSVRAAEHFSKLLGLTVSDSTIRNIVKAHSQFFPSLKEEIAKYAINFGVEKAVVNFSKLLNKKVGVRVVKKFKNLYLKSLTSNAVKNENLLRASDSEGVKREDQGASEENVVDVPELYAPALMDCSAASCFPPATSTSQNSSGYTYQNMSSVQPSAYTSHPFKSRESDQDMGQHFLLVASDGKQVNVEADKNDSNKGSRHTWHNEYQPSPLDSQVLINPRIELNSKADSAPVIPLPSLRKLKNSKKDATGKKRGSYTTYSPELRAEIGKYAAEHGSLKASNHFSETLGHDLAESTARTLKEKYLQKVKHSDVTSLGYSPRGRPLRLGKYDEVVQKCLRELFRSGEKVTSFLAITTAKEIVNKFEPELLEENGGSLVLNASWAKSFLKRIGVRNNS